MPPSIILSKDEARNADINGPDYRLHCAALSVLRIYLNGEKKNLSKLVSMYNNYHLTRPDDKVLKRRTLSDYIKKMKNTMSTKSNAPEQSKYIYLQIMKTNNHSLRQNVVVEEKEREQYGRDVDKIGTEIEIIQGRHNILYSGPKLDKRPHGAAYMRDIHESRRMKAKREIKSFTISRSTAGAAGVIRKEDVVAAYGHSKILKTIGATMTEGGLKKFHAMLYKFMKTRCKTDTVRVNAKSEANSVNVRVRYGFNQIQPDCDFKLRGEKMPSYNVRDFEEMSDELRSNMMKLAEGAQRFVSESYRSPMRDLNRIAYFAKRLNKAMGFAKSSSCFEYFDIVMTKNAQLKKHMDYKNDGRAGYDHCVVYSFFYAKHRVAVIMTTRRDVGAAFDRAMGSA